MIFFVIEFTDEAEKTIAQYKKSNPSAYKKLQKLLDELMEHPRTGTGHPEPLRGGNSITYSRHIAGRDRLIYNIYEERITVLAISVGGHYGDK